MRWTLLILKLWIIKTAADIISKKKVLLWQNIYEIRKDKDHRCI